MQFHRDTIQYLQPVTWKVADFHRSNRSTIARLETALVAKSVDGLLGSTLTTSLSGLLAARLKGSGGGLAAHGCNLLLLLEYC